FSRGRPRNETARHSAFGMGPARTHSHCAVGHARVLPEPEACFSGFSFGILAEEFNSAEFKGVGGERESVRAGSASDGETCRRSDDRSPRTHFWRLGPDNTARGFARRGSQRVSPRAVRSVAQAAGQLVESVSLKAVRPRSSYNKALKLKGEL